MSSTAFEHPGFLRAEKLEYGGKVYGDWADILKITIDSDTKRCKVLGSGTFGVVYLGELRHFSGTPTVFRPVAVKVQHPCYLPDTMLIEEYRFLNLLAGKNNVIELLMHIFDAERKILQFVFPFFEETPFRSLVIDATEDEVIFYMHTLLTALDWLHFHNIIHRDVKNGNFLFNRRTKTGKLIDLGCAVYMNELTEGCTRDPKLSGYYTIAPRLFYNTSSCIQPMPIGRLTHSYDTEQNAQFKLPYKRLRGTRGYKPLETLIESDLISSAIDIYAAGCIMILLLLRKESFFIQNSDAEGIMEMCFLYGANRVSQVALNLGKKLTIKMINYASLETEMQELSHIKEADIFGRLRVSSDPNSFSPETFKFLSTLLTLSPTKRISAANGFKISLF